VEKLKEVSMARKVGLGDKARALKDEVYPKVQKSTRADLSKACMAAEVETAEKAVEFVERISGAEEWTLDDWVELDSLSKMGRFFCEVKLVFSETDET